MELEGFFDKVSNNRIPSNLFHQLTSNLAICPILPRSHIREIAKRLATCEPTGKILNLARMINDVGPVADRGQALQIGIDAHNNLGISWAIGDIRLRPLGDSVAEVDGRLAAAFFSEAQELIAEDYAVAVDEDEDEGVAILCGGLDFLSAEMRGRGKGLTRMFCN